jgi:hypothetical protein
MNPVKMLGDAIRRRVGESKARSEHRDRIIERARAVMSRDYQVERAEVMRLDHKPPPAMRPLPRPGAAWFVVFGRPGAKGILIIEVDDATEQVNRVWAPPR